MFAKCYLLILRYAMLDSSPGKRTIKSWIKAERSLIITGASNDGETERSVSACNGYRTTVSPVSDKP